MDDTISRQAALDAFDTNLNELVIGGEKNAKTVENYLNGVLNKIKCLPSAQPELKKGKWIRNGWAITCSECGYDMPYTVRRFCPNCGAKMEVTDG